MSYSDIDWRAAPKHLNSIGQSQRDVSVIDCRPRCILFIKAQEQIDSAHVANSGLPIGALDHPALVLESSRDDHVRICPVSLPAMYGYRFAYANNPQLTSFGGRSLDQRFPYHHNIKAKYLPIAPSPSVMASMPQIHMEHARLPKESYVDISGAYKVHISMLRLCSSAHPSDYYRLSTSSFAVFLSKVNDPLRPEQALIPSKAAQDPELLPTRLSGYSGSIDRYSWGTVVPRPQNHRNFRQSYPNTPLQTPSHSDKLQQNWRSGNRPRVDSIPMSSYCAV